MKVELLPVLLLKDKHYFQHQNQQILDNQQLSKVCRQPFQQRQLPSQPCQPFVANPGDLDKDDVKDEMFLVGDGEGERAADVLHEVRVLEGGDDDGGVEE